MKHDREQKLLLLVFIHQSASVMLKSQTDDVIEIDHDSISSEF